MPSTPQHDDVFKNVAKLIASRATGQQQAGGSGLLFPTPGAAPKITPLEAPEREQGWNLGQGLIDTLSSGSYAIAGLGQKIGENIQAIGRGDIGGALDLANPLSALGALGGGISNRRTWSENLKDWGVEEGADTGILGIKGRDALGLTLDIALDPFWLIPGGAIATGIKATAKGSGIASAATKSGVELTGKGFEGARKAVAGTQQPYVTRNIGMTPEGITVPQNLQEFFPQGAKTLKSSALSNLIQGVKQTNADEYAAWSAARKAKKAAKKGDVTTPISNPTALDPTGEAGIKAAAVVGSDSEKVIENLSEGPAQQAASTIEDAVNASESVDNVVKEVEAVRGVETAADKVDQVTKNPSIYSIAREKLEPVRAEYMTARGMTPAKIDYAKVDVSARAVDMAKAYDNLVSAPNDPEVIAAYDVFKKEVADQYDYLVNEKGLKVEFIQGDPYQTVKVVDGVETTVPNSKAMLQDIVENNRLQVRHSDQDFAVDKHPILTVDENNMFRAVHDYFGHAASGRGVLADGEEAAWMSHSTMFSPLARRVMTTETRGQNSYYNFFNPDRKEFAPQKAALFPEEFTVLPDELSAVERLNDGSTMMIGRSVSMLADLKDRLLPTLGQIFSPSKMKYYSEEDLTDILKSYDELLEVQKVAPSDPVAQQIDKVLTVLDDIISRPTSTRYGGLGLRQRFYGEGDFGDATAAGLLTAMRQSAQASPAGQKDYEKGLAILHQILDEPVDATDLLESALKVEGREGVINPSVRFKRTEWGASYSTNGPTKPAFSMDHLKKYFADDELLADEANLAIAMGDIKVRPGTKRAAQLALKQRTLWEQFRARNADMLDGVAKAEKTEWLAANSVPASELHTILPDGTILGIGALPASIPKGTIQMIDGRPMTTLGNILSKLSLVVERSGGQGLPTYRVTGRPTAVEGARASRIEGSQVFVNEDFTDIMPSANVPIGLQGGRIIPQTTPRLDEAGRVVGLVGNTAEARALKKKLAARGRDIELDRFPIATQAWILDQVSAIKKRVKTKGVEDKRVLAAMDVEDLANKLYAKNQKIDSLADARVIAQMGKAGVKVLRKKQGRKYFIDAPMFRSEAGTGIAPSADFVGMSSTINNRKVKGDTPTNDPLLATFEGEDDWRLLNANMQKQETLTAYETTRKGRKYVSQLTARDSKKMQGLAVAQDAIGAIAEKITAKEFVASPEQAQLLGQILTQLNIKMAPNATPQEIFKAFAQKAPKAFEDTVAGFEAAAKNESLTIQLKLTFNKATSENISLMEAAARLDAADAQRKIGGWTKQKLDAVDDACREVLSGSDPMVAAAERQLGLEPSDMINQLIRYQGE